MTTRETELAKTACKLASRARTCKLANRSMQGAGSQPRRRPGAPSCSIRCFTRSRSPSLAAVQRLLGPSRLLEESEAASLASGRTIVERGTTRRERIAGRAGFRRPSRSEDDFRRGLTVTLTRRHLSVSPTAFALPRCCCLAMSDPSASSSAAQPSMSAPTDERRAIAIETYKRARPGFAALPASTETGRSVSKNTRPSASPSRTVRPGSVRLVVWTLLSAGMQRLDAVVRRIVIWTIAACLTSTKCLTEPTRLGIRCSCRVGSHKPPSCHDVALRTIVCCACCRTTADKVHSQSASRSRRSRPTLTNPRTTLKRCSPSARSSVRSFACSTKSDVGGRSHLPDGFARSHRQSVVWTTLCRRVPSSGRQTQAQAWNPRRSRHDHSDCHEVCRRALPLPSLCSKHGLGWQLTCLQLGYCHEKWIRWSTTCRWRTPATSPLPGLAGSATKSASSAKSSSCRCKIPSFSCALESNRPKACFCTGPLGPARPYWPKPLRAPWASTFSRVRCATSPSATTAGFPWSSC